MIVCCFVECIHLLDDKQSSGAAKAKATLLADAVIASGGNHSASVEIE